MMAKKTGRNEPCPCGSGKKYKHCCLDKLDNVIPFPRMPAGDEFERYKAFAESWDPAKGPVPTFQEYRGTPNPATESINELKKKIGDRIFESEAELRDFIERELRSENDAARGDFLGMTPSQMHSVLHTSLFENTALIELNESANPELLERAPVMRQCRHLLQLLSEDEKGIKATQRGNFPRKTVQDFYDKTVKTGEIFDLPPRNEDDAPELLRLHAFLEESGFLKKRQGRLSLTQTGKEFSAERSPFETYKALFKFFGETMDWLFTTRYPDPFIVIQNSLIFCLHMLRRKAGEFISGGELALVYKRAFPQLVKEMDIIKSIDIVSSGFCHLFLEVFAWPFGLVERKRDPGAFSSTEVRYKKTRLFDEVLRWKI